MGVGFSLAVFGARASVVGTMAVLAGTREPPYVVSPVDLSIASRGDYG